jgi:hypothetical protein
MKKIFFLIPVFLFTSLNLFAQVTQEWVRTQPFASGKLIAYDTSGYVAVSGWFFLMDSPPFTSVVKYNTSGVQAWANNCTGYTCGLSMDHTGNTYVASYTYPMWGALKQNNLIKYNQSGVQQWRINDTLFTEPDALISMKGDAAGNSYVLMYRNNKLETIKYNTSGTKLWVSTFSAAGSTDNNPSTLVIEKSGNIYVVGRSIVSNNSYFNLIKYNSSGVQQWVSVFPLPAPINAHSVNIALDSIGNIFMVAAIRDTGDISNVTTVKYNSSGTQQWVRYNSLGNSSPDPVLIAVDKSGGVIFSQQFKGIYKYSSSGVQQWLINTNVNSLTVDKNSSIYITKDLNYNSYEVHKYNSSGVQQWQISYLHYEAMYLRTGGIILDTSYNIYVTGGYSYYNPPSTSYAALTIKYSQLVGIKNISKNVPEKFELSQNYPNPFNPSTTINVSIPNESEVTLKIYDISGRETASLIDGTLKAGNYKYNFNASSLSSGIYFYKLSANGFSDTKKMILVK